MVGPGRFGKGDGAGEGSAVAFSQGRDQGSAGHAQSIRGEGCLAPRRLLLARPHGGVDAVAAQQLRVVAALDDLPALQHEDLVGIDDRRQPMSDD